MLRQKFDHFQIWGQQHPTRRSTSWHVATWWLEVKVLRKLLQVMEMSFGSVHIISRLDSQSKFQMFTLIFRPPYWWPYEDPLTWRLHTRLYNVAKNVATNISTLEESTHLKIGELSSLLIVHNITIFWLYPLNDFIFIAWLWTHSLKTNIRQNSLPFSAAGYWYKNIETPNSPALMTSASFSQLWQLLRLRCWLNLPLRVSRTRTNR